MQVILYKTASDNANVSKQLVQIDEVSATIKAPCKIEMPLLMLAYKQQIVDANYLYIPDYGRYYFITDRELQTGQCVLLSCKVDVLMSFKVGLLNVNAVIDRQEEKFNAYMVDTEYICDNKATIETRKFNNSFDSTLKTYLTIRG